MWPFVLQSLKEVCTISYNNIIDASKVYKLSVTFWRKDDHLVVLQPRDSDQLQEHVLNVRVNELMYRQMKHSTTCMNYIEVDMANFIHSYHLNTSWFGLRLWPHSDILEELDRVPFAWFSSASIIVMWHYLSVRMFQFSASDTCCFKEASVIPATFLVHERKFKVHHTKLFEVCTKPVKCTDEERGILNAIAKALPSLPQLHC